MTKIQLYDTTLRDGAQREGLSLSLDDKLKIARHLDQLGIDYIEGGWPGSNPKDIAFFERVETLGLTHATMTAFGSTRRAGVDVREDVQIRAPVVPGGTGKGGPPENGKDQLPAGEGENVQGPRPSVQDRERPRRLPVPDG